jgi:UDP-N-acetylmuramyl pentapeptide synthase
MEFFASQDTLAIEKLSLLQGLQSSGVAVLNADNPMVIAGKSIVQKSITYGFGLAGVAASNFEIVTLGVEIGTSFDITTNGQTENIFLANSVGKPSVYACLAAAAVGISQKMNLREITAAFRNYHQPAGRLKIIPGVYHTTILDDTYNAAPSSTIAALETLIAVPGGRKLAAIGHMAELGEKSEEGHREVGAKLAELKLDLVFLVGEKTRTIEDGLKKQNFAGKVFWFRDSDAAKMKVKENLQGGDVVLVKGSQSARMEKIVKEIMAHQDQAAKLLVRQSKQWLN